MGNDDAWQMAGIGTVHIKIFDGVVRDLTDMRYVPQMKKSIISVGVVESKGLKVTLENDILKIMKGSMVMMKGACNAPILRVRRRYRDVYTQVRNTLTYIR